MTWLEWLGGSARPVGIALLVAARVAPLAFLAPWLALRGTPPALRLALVLSLTVAMTPIALATAPPLPGDVLALAVALTREATLGAVFAVATAVPLHALEHAGRLIDALRGASPGDVTLPSGDRTSPMGALHGMLGATLFLVLGGHRLVIDAHGSSLIAVPAGAAIAHADLASIALGAARIVVAALTLAVSFAAPALVSLVVVEVAMGLVGRASPAIPMHFAGMPLRAAIGVAAVLLGMAVLVPHLGPIFESAIDAASALLGSARP